MPKPKSDSLVGLYFHSYKDGRMKWQGLVKSVISDGYYLVQLFDWLMGAASDMRIVHLGNMTGWDFYADAEDWKYKGDIQVKRDAREVEEFDQGKLVTT